MHYKILLLLVTKRLFFLTSDNDCFVIVKCMQGNIIKNIY